MTKYPQLNIRLDDQILSLIDDFRRSQDDIPNRPEAVRRLVRYGSRMSGCVPVILILSQAIQKAVRLEDECDVLLSVRAGLGSFKEADSLIAGLEKAIKSSGKMGACEYLASCIEFLSEDI